MHASSLRHLSVLVLSASVAACAADTTIPSDAPGAVTFSVASSPATVSAASLSSTSLGTSTSLVVGRGKDTLQLDSVNVVFSRVVLHRAGGTSCGDAGHDDSGDHDCAELKAGPILVSLPLTAGAQTVFSVSAPAGSYTGMKLWTHRPNRADSGPNTQAFLAAHPDYEGTSIRVYGKFNGAAFTWRGDPEAEIEQTFTPPLAVTGTAGLSLTLKIDVATWFQSDTGALLNPATTYYPQIANAIKASFRAFEDKSHTGNDDHGTGRP
ncbi:MAG: hypothetical protein ABJA80_05845 [bacterium]